MADADIQFSVKKRKPRKITFTLAGDDHVYEFTEPKQAAAMVGLINTQGVDEIKMVRSTFEWLQAGLKVKGDYQRIIDRLSDPEDDLDSGDLEAVAERLMEEIGKRPTT